MTPNPIKFIGFGDLHVPKPYKFTGFGEDVDKDDAEDDGDGTTRRTGYLKAGWPDSLGVRF